mmetsp:Transcript_17455/g.37839  ORF Transcript_17455/g.37839 Transcript_17455/m.37839 type:complete len:348 (-) Transcript_17455:83-1126(-)
MPYSAILSVVAALSLLDGIIGITPAVAGFLHRPLIDVDRCTVDHHARACYLQPEKSTGDLETDGTRPQALQLRQDTSLTPNNRPMKILDAINVSLHKSLWWTLTRIGTRNIISAVRFLLPWYRDTIFYFRPPQAVSAEKLIALTIDDGLSRGGSNTSMVDEVMSILECYNARATFFVCSDYCSVDDRIKKATRDLVLVHGHEIGNHMVEDRSGYYSRLSEVDFREQYESANLILTELARENVCWFRAPQGVFTPTMRRVISSSDIPASHVLGDVFCDDWALACKDSRFVCDTMVRQATEGSIAIVHMPERGSDREACLKVLESFLQAMTDRGYKVVSISQMAEACGG